MATDPRIGRGEERIRINMGEASEVEYWAKALGVSKERLIEVASRVGESLKNIRRELSSKRS